MDDQQEPLEPPRETWRDFAHQAGLATVNVLTGGAGGTLLSMIVSSPLAARRQQFEAEVSDRIAELEQQGRLHSKALADNEQFVSTYVEATLAAVRTHEAEKREALRNAVINAALIDSPDDSLQQFFVALVAEFTPWHLRLLRFFHDPKATFVDAGKPQPQLFVTGNLPNELEKLYPSLKTREDFVEAILADLNGKRMTEVPRYRISGGDETVFAKRSTPLGDQFLRFISEPT